MRNIALLEWGPASLYYILPREKVKVRTVWLNDGPKMPPFLSTMDDAKGSGSEVLVVRYALSAFEDLNSAIRNLRKCFGFPYQEYIGYLNTLTRKFRARREHESLLPGLRRWAIFGNVDAVLWIDYAKSNQPPGSFKMGPRNSRPFSAAHMEMCSLVAGGAGVVDRDGEESEAAWSDIDEEQDGGPLHHVKTAPTAMVSWNGSADPLETSRRPSNMEAGHGVLSGGLRTPLLRKLKNTRLPPGHPGQVQTARASRKRSPRPGAQDKFKTELQEEVIPAHGSIYQRSIAPGPGYYGGDAIVTPRTIGPSFGKRFMSVIDQANLPVKDLPGPGDYREKPALADLKHHLGCFNRAEKGLAPLEAAKKLPFISAIAAASEGFATLNPNAFATVIPNDSGLPPFKKSGPEFSFGQARRPF